ncbi:uncharacterized protein N0V89_001929 [Didymosphaeria variabile]|uniref:Uncharacterized protein n=1 Tax=Didymosphaeria variabile TaxID=1932322 RepID=A0A9W9CE26_9PLEO|nr:uncharacterized protein N0V89_001929 [Didymosphaeria variabile]KAJ4357354.1 hypothetical protein N0V89_001929 [Didymosphaeria variabile]
MFSTEDILEMYNLFPPINRSLSEKSEELPLLIQTNSGYGFVTARSLHQEFERLVDMGAARISVSSASNDLKVDFKVVLQLVKGNPVLALLSQDGNSIVARQERDAIVKDMVEALAKELVHKAKFTQSHDLHQESLGSVLRISSIKEILAEDTDDYLLSKTYSIALVDEIDQRLKSGLANTETIELRSQSLPGTPPIWLIRQGLDQISRLDEEGNNYVSQLYIEKEADVIRCIPKKSILSQRDELIAGLQSGEILFLDLGHFGRTFGETYPSSQALEKHFSESPSITVLGAFAISTARISKVAGEAESKLGHQGYLDLNAILPFEVPREIGGAVLDSVTQMILTAESDDGKSIRQLGNYLLKEESYNIQQQALLNIAKAQAERQWDLLKELPDKDPKFQMAELLALIPDDEQVLRTVAQQKDSEIAAAEHFSSEISELESKNENDFSTFWTEKMSPRVYNYHEGLKSVDEAKLHDQLADLFANYLQKDLVPDVLAKARSQGLVRSRRTRKNVNRFEATLKASKSDLSGILSTFEKFSKKQGLPETGPEAAEEAKKVAIQDMVRRMQKPKTDAPSMFLSLLVVLFAKHHPGVVYATGKFAPKLLKQLRTKLVGEEYEQVEKWKEQAKAGTLTKEDRDFMVQMADRRF